MNSNNLKTSTASEFAASIAAVVHPGDSRTACSLTCPLPCPVPGALPCAHPSMARTAAEVAQHIDARTPSTGGALDADALEDAFLMAIMSEGVDALPAVLVDLAEQHPTQWHKLNAALDRASAQAHAFAAIAGGHVNPHLFVHGSTEGRAVVCAQRVLAGLPANARASRVSAQARAVVAAVLSNPQGWRDFVAHLALMRERAHAKPECAASGAAGGAA